ncbi:MAG: ABC transporter ATP-binding protein [Candidatus Bipolaricaulota bacterium]|nr:ABC transporter ATP-binding protein [Candidatus Bipolaricaulota bacterium]MDW8127172.1 ABC transporter ATP-binding protein [Candidatus Bipolaricaulota bacterium]
MPVELVLAGLTKVFRGFRSAVVAVDHVDLEVEKGELVTLLGPSGCGKTTTLRLIGGFEVPTEGEIYLRGQRITHLPPQRRPTATVFQSYALFPHMTVFENVAFGLKVRRFPRAEIRRQVQEVLNLVGLTGLENRLPAKLSGGQQQRVALARVLVIKPQVLLFDEPLSNLDAKLRVETREHIRRIQKEVGITSLYVTHDQAEAMAISDRIVVMNQGRIQQVGFPQDVYLRPANPFVADFIGRANFLKARVVAQNATETEVELASGLRLRLPQRFSFASGEEVQMVVRPEAVDFCAPEEGHLQGQVVLAQLTGPSAHYRVALSSGEQVEVEVLGALEKGLLAPGTPVGLRLHLKSLHLLRA